MDMALFYAGTAITFVVVTIIAPKLADSPMGKLLAVVFAWGLMALLVGATWLRARG